MRYRVVPSGKGTGARNFWPLGLHVSGTTTVDGVDVARTMVVVDSMTVFVVVVVAVSEIVSVSVAKVVAVTVTVSTSVLTKVETTELPPSTETVTVSTTADAVTVTPSTPAHLHALTYWSLSAHFPTTYSGNSAVSVCRAFITVMGPWKMVVVDVGVTVSSEIDVAMTVSVVVSLMMIVSVDAVMLVVSPNATVSVDAVSVVVSVTTAVDTALWMMVTVSVKTLLIKCEHVLC